MLRETPAIRDFDRQGRAIFDLPWSAELAELERAVRRFAGYPPNANESIQSI